MYRTFKRLWKKGLLDEKTVYDAVVVELITAEQYKEIVGEEFVPPKDDEV